MTTDRAGTRAGTECDRGATSSEYALLLAGVVLAIIVVVGVFAWAVMGLFESYQLPM